MSYVGLSGGFGNLTLGRVGAAGAKTGGILDNSFHYGNSYTGFRTGNAVSYANSMGGVNVQLDAIMDPKKDSDGAIDEMQLGLSLNLGDIGKIAFSHVQVENHKPVGMKTVDIAGTGTDPMIKGVEDLMIKGVEDLMIKGVDELKIVDQDGMEITDLGLQIVGTEGLSVNAGSLVLSGSVDPAHGDVTVRTTGGSLMVDDDGALMWSPSMKNWGNDDINVDSISGITHMIDTTTVMPILVRSNSEPSADTPLTIGTGNGEFSKSTDANGNIVYTEMGCDENCMTTEHFANERNKANLTLEERVAILEDGTAAPRVVQVHPIVGVTSTAKAQSHFVTDVNNGNLMITGKDGLTVEGIENLKIVNQDGDEVEGFMIEGTDDLTVEGNLTVEGSLTFEPGTAPETQKVPYDNSDIEYGSKANHVAAEFGFGAVTAFVGYSQIESNKAGSMKDKITHYGLRGSLGESGVGFLVQLRNEELKGSKPTDSDRDPYVVNLSKSLGDGASAYIEHGTQDAKGEKAKTRIGMIVNF